MGHWFESSIAQKAFRQGRPFFVPFLTLRKVIRIVEPVEKREKARGGRRQLYVGQALRFAQGNYLLARSREQAIILRFESSEPCGVRKHDCNTLRVLVSIGNETAS